MDGAPTLILQIPGGGVLQHALEQSPPPSVSGGEAVVQQGPTDAHGNLEALAGEVVISLPSPEGLVREAHELRRVLRGAGRGEQPLVVLLEAADELREDELRVVLDAAAHAERAVILRVARPA